MTSPTKQVLDCATGEVTTVPLTPDEVAEAEAGQAAQSRRQASEAFARQEDDERMRIINERAADDPAYAALAEYVIRGRTP